MNENCIQNVIGASEAKPPSSGWCETGSAWYVTSIPYMEQWIKHIAQLAGVIMSIRQR